MNSPFTQARANLARATAGLQAEVGLFLMQKAHILELPENQLKINLLAAQNALEARAQDVVGRATALQTAFTQPFDFFKASSYAALAPQVKNAGELLKQASSLRADMAAHIAAVDQAQGMTPKQSTPAQAPYLLWKNVAIGAGVLFAAWAWKRGAKRKGARRR